MKKPSRVNPIFGIDNGSQDQKEVEAGTSEMSGYTDYSSYSVLPYN